MNALYMEAIEELAASWVNGNRSDLIERLAKAHPCITALVLVFGGLPEDDQRRIANRLLDHKVDQNQRGS